MDRPPYFPLIDLVMMIGHPQAREGCLRMLRELESRFKATPGSTHNHQTWDEGYWDHICDAMNIAVLLYGPLASTGRIMCVRDDALLALFLHDIEKPWKYEKVDGKVRIVPELLDKTAQHEFRLRKAAEYGIPLSDDVKNAIQFSEGEGDQYRSTGRQMVTLASFVHTCDHLSARYWPDHPLETNDSWSGPKRPSAQ